MSQSSSTNPFEDESGVYRVLVNAEGEYSLWPDFAALPAGWDTAHGPDVRAACVAYIEEHWTGLAPTGGGGGGFAASAHSAREKVRNS
ncbi:MbtH family protein [Streptomyces sp. NBC_01136]|uniref:MbtH family protein n=1 Tax=unclassified Streptomyces TaxID=2593676 RepID=UPI00324CBAC7|nr:MbtH family protein [Streptomyces sp. NBC_01136]